MNFPTSKNSISLKKDNTKKKYDILIQIIIFLKNEKKHTHLFIHMILKLTKI